MKKKLIITGILVAIFLSFYVVDCIVAASYSIKVSDVNPSPSPADAKTPVSITVQLTKGNEPIEGHVLYALTKGGGSFKSVRLKTNKDGEAVFTYYPYLASQYLPAGKVEIEIRDESNSLLVSVPAKMEFNIELIDPPASDNNSTVDSIFG